MQGCYYALSTRTTALSDIAKLAAMLPPAVLYLSGELEPLPGAMSYKILARLFQFSSLAYGLLRA